MLCHVVTLLSWYQIGTGIIQEVGTELDTIQLSIFSHRFMSIAEQMGRCVWASVCMCAFACMGLRLYVCLCVYGSLYVWASVCVCVCVYVPLPVPVCLCACVYAHVCLTH